MHAHRQRCDELTERLDSAERENARLLKENDTVRSERDTAEARISVLEQELQRSLLEKEQIKNTENQKTSKLRAQLSEEVSDKKKQIKALEDALQEIQRLKETVKTERRSESDVASREDIGTLNDIRTKEKVKRRDPCFVRDRGDAKNVFVRFRIRRCDRRPAAKHIGHELLGRRYGGVQEGSGSEERS